MQFVLISLSGWGLVFYGGYKFFTRGKKNKEEVHFFLQKLLSQYLVIRFALTCILFLFYTSVLAVVL